MLEGYEVAAFISVRSYANFYAAAHCEAARSGTFRSFHQLSSQWKAATRRWPEVLHDITVVFPRARIVVWPYEIFQVREDEIFDRLLGDHHAKVLQLSHEVMRPSMPSAAMNVLEFIGSTAPWLLHKRLVKAVEGIARRTFKSRSYDPWSWDDRKHLEQLYASDLQTIANDPRYELIA
jgi:hypothetical protein